jgi:hypothetical protein
MFRHSFRPTLEELNARDVPSSGGIVAPPITAAPVQVMAPLSHPLFGTTNGNYTLTNAADTGATIQFGGPITLAGLGNFQMTGSLQGPGDAAGRATGQIILTNQYGSLTVELHSGILPAHSSIPTELVYSISGGTGAYAQTRGYGIADFSFVQATFVYGTPHTGLFGMKLS